MRLAVPASMTDCCLAAVGLLACAACSGCGPENSAADQPLIVVVSGDTAGWIVPCGCASSQSGGLPRRGTCVDGLRRRAEVIVADAGGAPGGVAPYDRLKFEAILQGELAMGVAAHNIGGPEARLGPDYLRRVARKLNVPLVSANVCDSAGQPVAEPLRIVEAAGRRVALVGVLGQQYATEELQVTPPHQAVLDTLQASAGRYDTAVVLAYLPEEELRQFAETLPEADLVVGGPTGQPVPPVSIGPALLASATHQGKFLARFDASGHASPDRWTGTIVELDEQFVERPEQVANLRQFYRQLAKRDFAPADTSFVKPLLSRSPGFRIVGNQTCRDCHPEDFQLWESSKHAHAWDSLREKGAHVDPECQRCHATGYGLPGGFVSVGRSPDSIQVGCESCHGPSEQHAIDPETRTAYFSQAKDHCTGCHDRENSPQFDYEKYWARIAHGTSPDPADTSGETSEEVR